MCIIVKEEIKKSVLWPEPFQPDQKEEHWCGKCDQKTVKANDLSTGKFFVVFGHCYQAGSRQYDGPFNGVMFALCSECLND